MGRIRGTLQFGTWGVLLAGLLAAGCAPGRTSLFPEGQRLTREAKALRAAQPVAVAWPRELDKSVTGPLVVEPGDVLLVIPVDLDSPARLPGDQPVFPDGTINLGQYGHLLVAGKTVEQIQPEVQRLVEAKTRDPGVITVRLVSRLSKVYYVLGEVNAPGSFALNGYETALDAIVSAGGLTEGASRKNIILSRPTKPGCPRIVLPICYDDIVQAGDTSTNYQIRPGDRIFVPTKGFFEDCFGRHREDCPPCGMPQIPRLLPPEPGHCDEPDGCAPWTAPPAPPTPGPILLQEAGRAKPAEGP